MGLYDDDGSTKNIKLTLSNPSIIAKTIIFSLFFISLVGSYWILFDGYSEKNDFNSLVIHSINLLFIWAFFFFTLKAIVTKNINHILSIAAFFIINLGFKFVESNNFISQIIAALSLPLEVFVLNLSVLLYSVKFYMFGFYSNYILYFLTFLYISLLLLLYKNIKGSSNINLTNVLPISIKNNYIFGILFIVCILASSLLIKVYITKNSTSITSSSISMNGFTLGQNGGSLRDYGEREEFELGEYGHIAKKSNDLNIFITAEDAKHSGVISDLTYDCEAISKTVITVDGIGCKDKSESIESKFTQHKKYCDPSGDFALYVKGNAFISYDYAKDKIYGIGLTDDTNSLISPSPYREEMSDCTGKDNDYKTYKKLGYSSVEQLREHKRAEKAKQDELKAYPYYAYLSCGFQGRHINILACFGGRVDTELELKNGNDYKLYKVWEIGRVGTETSEGVLIKLHQNFSIKAQNSSDSLILGLKIKDRSTNEFVFQKQVARFDVINVGN